MTGQLERDYREANRELSQTFKRYLRASGFAPLTIVAYGANVDEFLRGLGVASVLDIGRTEIHQFLARLLKRELSERTIDRYTKSLRSFYKFLRVAGLIRLDPMWQVPHRKFGRHLPRVLTIEEIERIIKAAKTPAESAIVETLYATGVRVSELCGIKLENISFRERKILIQRGKGGKDRYVLFGKHAALAIEKYQQWRPSQVGYLFEAPTGNGKAEINDLGPLVFQRDGQWHGTFRVDQCRDHTVSLGSVADLPTEAEAREALGRIVATTPNVRLKPICMKRSADVRSQRPYNARAIQQMLRRLGHAAGVEGVYPHAFRHAFATHLLASGADLRVIQELLGHALVSTTQVYTHLTSDEVRKVYEKAHPHASEGGTDVEEE